MWDVLAAAYLGCENLCSFKEEKIEVITSTPNEGQTKPVKHGEGTKIVYADEVNTPVFRSYILEQFSRNFESKSI